MWRWAVAVFYAVLAGSVGASAMAIPLSRFVDDDSQVALLVGAFIGFAALGFFRAFRMSLSVTTAEIVVHGFWRRTALEPEDLLGTEVRQVASGVPTLGLLVASEPGSVRRVNIASMPFRGALEAFGSSLDAVPEITVAMSRRSDRIGSSVLGIGLLILATVAERWWIGWVAFVGGLVALVGGHRSYRRAMEALRLEIESG